MIELTPFSQHWYEDIFGLGLGWVEERFPILSSNDTSVESTFLVSGKSWLSLTKRHPQKLQKLYLKHLLEKGPNFHLSSQDSNLHKHRFVHFTLLLDMLIVQCYSLNHVWKIIWRFHIRKYPWVLVSLFASPDFLSWGLTLLCLCSNTLATSNRYFLLDLREDG